MGHIARCFMNEMNLEEAQLFRMLGRLFGADNVVWNMSVRTVCGGDYPSTDESAEVIAAWAEAFPCLFTVVDANDLPKMVVEFAPNFSRFVDVQQMTRHQKIPTLLEARGIRYISITPSEFNEMIDPGSALDLVSFLKDKFGVEDVDDSCEEGD